MPGIVGNGGRILSLTGLAVLEQLEENTGEGRDGNQVGDRGQCGGDIRYIPESVNIIDAGAMATPGIRKIHLKALIAFWLPLVRS